MREFFGSGPLGNSWENWLFAAFFAAGGFVVGRFVSWTTANVLRGLSARTKTRLDDILLAIAGRPLALVIAVAGAALGIDRLSLSAETAAAVEKAFTVLATFVAAWTLTRVMDAVMDEYLVPFARKTEGTLDDQLLPILRKGFKLLAWSLAALFALKNVGYDVGALLAGLGLGGVAVALAAKDTLSNFFGSVAVFVDRPFKLNERIKVAGFDGTVTEIGIRTSRLRTLDNRVVTIPNAVFAASPIENVSSEPHTKVTQTVELSRGNGAEKTARAVALLKEIGASVEGTDGVPAAGVTALGEFSHRATFIFYVRKGADYIGTIDAVNLETLRRFEAEGIALAYPTRVLSGAPK